MPCAYTGLHVVMYARVTPRSRSSLGARATRRRASTPRWLRRRTHRRAREREVMAEETLAIVNEANDVVGEMGRRRTVASRALGRGAFAIVLRRNAALVTRRSMRKDVWPGALDAVTSGACQGRDGGAYATTMRRELREELGADASVGANVSELFTFPYEDKYMRVWGACFEVVLRNDAEVAFEDGEVEADSASWEPLDELARSLEDGREEFTPIGKYVLRSYLAFKTTGALPPQTWSERHIEPS